MGAGVKRIVYRVGDKVCFKWDARFVEHVGYEVDYWRLRGYIDADSGAWKSLDLSADEASTLSAINQARLDYTLTFERDFRPLVDALRASRLTENERQKIRHELETLAIRRVIARLQGKQRRLFFGQQMVEPPRSMEVLGKRVCQIGKHYPSSGYQDDVEPGGLDERQTVVLLRTHWGEVWSADVEKIDA